MVLVRPRSGRSRRYRRPDRGPQTFSYDGALGPEASQADVYEAAAARVVAAASAGYDGTVLAYVRRAELPSMNRGAAAAATWIYESRRRRGRDVDIPLMNRGAVAAATWIFLR